MSELLVQVIPTASVDLNVEARRIRRTKSKTFTAERRGKRWKHSTYPGWIWIAAGQGGVLTARVCGKGAAFPDRILWAFTGFLARHLHDKIRSIHITRASE